jgi:hypothetical protein
MCAVVVLCLSVPAWAQLTWHVQTVDSTGSVGSFSSLALDHSFRPNISYYDATNADLKFARWDGTKWIIQAVDSVGDVGRYCFLHLDSTDHPNISYYDATQKALKYARFNGTAWVIEVVDKRSGQDVGQFTSIFLDSHNVPHISYYVATAGQLWIADRNGSPWKKTRVDSANHVGQYTSLALDTLDRAHISYYDVAGANLKHAFRASTTWTTEFVDKTGDVGQYSSLALASGNSPRISYYDRTHTALKFARVVGAGWSTQTVDNAADDGAGTSLVIDSYNQPEIAYVQGPTQVLRFARFDGAIWSIEVADKGPGVGQCPSMALESHGLPTVSYADTANGDLKYGTPAGAWFFFSPAAGFVTDGVNPNSGVANKTQFTFQVIFQDVFGTGPGNPVVIVKLGATVLKTLPLSVVDLNPNFFTGATLRAVTTLPVGSAYTYRFQALSTDGTFAGGPPSQPEGGPVVTATLSANALLSVAAAPSHAGAEVSLRLLAPAAIDARVLNLAGRPVRRLATGRECPAGTSRLLWDGRDDGGLSVPAGNYLVEVLARVADGSQSRGLCSLMIGR